VIHTLKIERGYLLYDDTPYQRQFRNGGWYRHARIKKQRSLHDGVWSQETTTPATPCRLTLWYVDALALPIAAAALL